MKILAIDDERLGLDRIKRVGARLGIDNIDTLQNPQQALDVLQTCSYDIIMLDIQMPGIDGLTLASSILDVAPNAFIVFVTAHSEFALKSLEIGAYDYVLKPIDENAFLRIIKKAQRLFKQEIKLVGKIAKDIVVLTFGEIVYIKADLSETSAQTKNGFVVMKKKISELELIMPSDYLKIHRSYLINASKIQKIEPTTLGRYVVYFYETDDCVTTSKDGAKVLKDYMSRLA